ISYRAWCNPLAAMLLSKARLGNEPEVKITKRGNTHFLSFRPEGCDAFVLLNPKEVMGSEKITLTNESMIADRPVQIRKITR
nr:hypothetical protein [Tanacetum cinerariifolium]